MLSLALVIETTTLPPDLAISVEGVCLIPALLGYTENPRSEKTDQHYLFLFSKATDKRNHVCRRARAFCSDSPRSWLFELRKTEVRTDGEISSIAAQRSGRTTIV